jgi:hypothetical protein
MLQKTILHYIIIALLALNISHVFADEDLIEPTQKLPPFQWKVGEELIYKVKYSFLTIGQLHFFVLNTDTINGRKVYRCRMHMKSSSAIPFVNIDDIYESHIDEDVYSHRSEAWEQGGDHILYTRYDFDYPNKQVKMFMEKRFKDSDRTELVLDSTAALDGVVQDGFSLLYYARANVDKRDTTEVTVFTFNAFNQTAINFTGMLSEVKAKDKKVYGYYLDGKMKFVGIAGIKEDFKGWFSQDTQRVPLKAKMKAFIGSVNVYIDEWKNWDGDSLLTAKEN